MKVRIETTYVPAPDEPVLVTKVSMPLEPEQYAVHMSGCNGSDDSGGGFAVHLTKEQLRGLYKHLCFALKIEPEENPFWYEQHSALLDAAARAVGNSDPIKTLHGKTAAYEVEAERFEKLREIVQEQDA